MRRVKFEDVATRVNTREDKDNTSLLYYVGGDHIESGELVVHNKGLIAGSTIGPMFYFGFKKGDILLVSRNPHLRKAAMVTFDGICSEKTFVIGTKDEKVLLQKYLAVIVQSNSFWNYCEEHKSGGVNFFVNWSTLAKYEFDLPDIEEQARISERVWSAYYVKESYRRLISATDELVKSRFIEMFGNPNSNPRCLPTGLVSDCFTLQMGKTPARDTARYWAKDGSGNKWISIADMSRYEYFTNDTEEYISESAIQETGMKLIPKNTVIMSFKLTIGRVSVTSEPIYSNEAIVAFIPKTQDYSTRFLYYLVKYYDWLENAALAVKGKTLNKESIGKNRLIIPSRESQNEFAAFAEQADKSKFELKQALDKIDKVLRSLLQ